MVNMRSLVRPVNHLTNMVFLLPEVLGVATHGCSDWGRGFITFTRTFVMEDSRPRKSRGWTGSVPATHRASLMACGILGM